MSKALDQIKQTKPVYWFEIREGIKLGAVKLTPNQWLEYVETIQKLEGQSTEFAEYFAQFIVDEDCEQAFTVEDYKEYLSNDEMEYIALQFRVANGMEDVEGEPGN